MAAQTAAHKSAAQARAAAAPKSASRSAKQIAAGRKWAAAGRKAQIGKPKSAKQIAASRGNLAKARAAQAARRSGKAPVSSAKRATAPLGIQVNLNPHAADSGEPGEYLNLHLHPVCAASAIAESLFAMTGLALTDMEVLSLADAAGSCSVSDMLELVYSAGAGFGPGARLVSFRRCDEDLIVPGLVCGLTLPGSGLYHAVLSHPGGMLSWSTVQPWLAAPEEAWYLEWELPGS